MTTADQSWQQRIEQALDAAGEALEALASAMPHQGVHNARDRFREAWPAPEGRQAAPTAAQVLTTAAVGEGGAPPPTSEPEASGDEPPSEAPASAAGASA